MHKNITIYQCTKTTSKELMKFHIDINFQKMKIEKNSKRVNCNLLQILLPPGNNGIMRLETQRLQKLCFQVRALQRYCMAEPEGLYFINDYIFSSNPAKLEDL